MGVDQSKSTEQIQLLSKSKRLKLNKFEIKHSCLRSQCYDVLPLHGAAVQADEKKVEAIIINSEYPFGQVDCHGRTPLHCAASFINRNDGDRRDRINVVRLLLNQLFESEPEKLRVFIAAEDIQKRTALHYSAENELPDIMELLLEAGANPVPRDVQGLTPLHLVVEGNTEEAIKCAKLLLAANESQKDLPCKSTRHFLQRNQTPLHIATSEKSWNMVRYLLETGCDPSVVDSEGRTPLHVAATAGNCRGTVKCVELLLAHCDASVTGTPTMEENETALHLAAEFGHHSVVKTLLDQERVDVWALNRENQTALHRAAMCWFPDKALLCTQHLLENEQVGDNEMLRFAFLRDVRNDTALHIACRRKFNKVAELYLLSQSKPWRWLDDDIISIIYDKVPQAMLVWMDKAFSYVNMDFKERTPNLEVDFTSLTGYADPFTTPQQETKYLIKVLRAGKKPARNRVLLHPLVQIFLNMKWAKFRWLSWASLGLQFCWLVTYTLFILEVYTEDCTSVTVTVTEYAVNRTNITQEIPKEVEVQCPYDRTFALSLVGVLIPLSVIIATKELFRTIDHTNYRRSPTTWIQCFVLILFAINLYPVFSGIDTRISTLQYGIAAVGSFLAWALSLREMAKIPRFGKYSEVLAKVSLNSILMLLFYLPILVAFAITFRILIPGKGQYQYIPLAIVKILTMMTGEFEYEEIFYGPDTQPRVPLTAQLMFLVFVFMATIVLLNLLIGLAVQDPDVQNIIQEAEINRTINKLEQIFVLESFIIWLRRNLVGMERLSRFFSSLNVTSQKIGPNFFYATKIVIPKNYFPEDGEDEIHQLALGTKLGDI